MKLSRLPKKITLNNNDIKKYIKNIQVESSLKVLGSCVTTVHTLNVYSSHHYMKIALCAIAKNENLYIREWVEHYKRIGIDHIFLYDNNELDGERFEDVINDYIKSGFVEVISVRGIQVSQSSSYIDVYNKYKIEYDWMLFFDIDEFLYMNNGLTLKNYLRKFSNIDCIFVNWMLYGDNGNLKYENKPVMERFTNPCKDVKNNVEYSRTNYLVKSIVRCINKPLNSCTTHKFMFKDGVYSDSDHNIIKYKGKYSILRICYDNMYLKHYITKSWEEFFNRLRLNWLNNRLKWRRIYSIDDIVRNYFIINEKTPEKYKYILDYINKLKK